jgi:alpha-D-ribose 1-methylphosphonate 5-triphosphate synthase subunit PhnH
MTTTLARMGAGFADPTHGAQQSFRVLLDAMSAPGSILTLPDSAIDGLAPSAADMAPPTGIGMAATLLTLLDADTPVHLAGALANAQTQAYLRFHTGARAAPLGATTSVVALSAREANAELWSRLVLGSDEAPQDGATLIVEVDALSNDAMLDTPRSIALTLRGPGVKTTQRLAVDGLPEAFWRWRLELQSAMPRGVDIVLVQGTRLAAIPRSSLIELER